MIGRWNLDAYLVLSQHLNGSAYSCQRIANLVGNAGCQLPNLHQFLCPQQLLLHVLLFEIRPLKLRRPLLDPQLQFVVRFSQGLCRLVPFANVSDYASDQQPLFGLQRAKADFNREFGAVFALRAELIAGTHRSSHRSGKVARTMFEMPLPESFRQEYLNQLAQNLVTHIAKQPLRLVVDQNDLALGVDNHNRVGGRLQEAAKLCLSSFRYGAGSLLIKQMGAFSFDRGFACADEVILQICL